MQETQVRSLGGEDPLEKEMATHSSSFAWRIPWREEPGSLQPWGHKSQTWLRDYTTTTSLIHNRSVGVKFPKADKGFHTAPKAKKMPRKHRLWFFIIVSWKVWSETGHFPNKWNLAKDANFIIPLLLLQILSVWPKTMWGISWNLDTGRQSVLKVGIWWIHFCLSAKRATVSACWVSGVFPTSLVILVPSCRSYQLPSWISGIKELNLTQQGHTAGSHSRVTQQGGGLPGPALGHSD